MPLRAATCSSSTNAGVAQRSSTPGRTVQSPAPGGTQSSTPPGLPSKLDDDATVVAPDAPGSATPKRVDGSAHTDSSNGAGAPRGDELNALLAQHAAGLLALQPA